MPGPKRPTLTFPKDVADYVTTVYASSGCILEYGSGGSTILASEMDQKTIYSVESDGAWAKDLKAFIESSPDTLSIPNIIHVDLGPTKKWGYPDTSDSFRKYHHYPLSVWNGSDNIAPDVALVDGRFRVACFFACFLNTRKEMFVLFDDYAERPHYWVVEDFVKPIDRVGRMAVFKINPSPFADLDISKIIGPFSDPM